MRERGKGNRTQILLLFGKFYMIPIWVKIVSGKNSMSEFPDSESDRTNSNSSSSSSLSLRFASESRFD